MRSFIRKASQPQKAVSANAGRSNKITSGLAHQEHPASDLQQTSTNCADQLMPEAEVDEREAALTKTSIYRFAQDFSRIPIHPATEATRRKSIGNLSENQYIQEGVAPEESKEIAMTGSTFSPVKTNPQFDFTHIPVTARIQRKPIISAPADPLEREADEVANQVTGMIEPAPGNPASVAIQRQGATHEDLKEKRNRTAAAPSANSGAELNTGIALRAAAGNGLPLSVSERSYFEPRFGYDFSQVRLHTGVEAAEATRAIQARAYTIGHNIVFSPREYAPTTTEGMRLLAHELTHVVQQGKGIDPTQGLAIQRAPDNTAAPAGNGSTRSFGLVFAEFNWERYSVNRQDRAKVFAQELMHVHMTQQEILDHAIEIAEWAQENGAQDVRDYMLDKARTAWLMESATEGGEVMSAGGLKSLTDGPEALVHQAEAAARAGDHKTAFSLFGHAHEFYSYQILQLTEKRGKALEGGQSSWPAGLIEYRNAQHVYDEMRGIYGFYLQLEKEAREAGDHKKAAEMAIKSEELRADLMKNWSSSGAVIIAEVSQVETPRGPGLTLHGANSAETDLTALPGLKPPEEVGNNLQWQDLDKVQTALGQQADFLAEITRIPEMQKAFKGKTPDMNNLNDRLLVWKTMFGQTSGPAALSQLMGLIGRYLKAFTKHTEYNVRDWGTNYLDTKMPTDLAGRAEQDCGVYALTVAWETFKTINETNKSGSVKFKLIAMLDHVTLIIEDQSEFYLVNNDEITGPHKGNPLEMIGQIWAKLRGRVFTAGPAAEVELGATSDKPVNAKTADAQAADFKKNIWTRYLKNVDLRLKATLPIEDIEALKELKKVDPKAYDAKIAEIGGATYDTFYADQERFDAEAHALDVILDRIVTGGNADEALKKMMPQIDDAIIELGVLFGKLAAPPVTSSGKVFGMFSRTSKPHPLARAAMAMMRFEKLGGQLSAEQQNFIRASDMVPLFHAAMEAFRKNNMPGTF
jgi:hypothetical protein